MRRTRHVLAVMVVTTALCADHVAAAAPLSGEVRSPVGQVGELAGRLVRRLSQSFRRVVPSAVPAQARQSRLTAPARLAAPADQSLSVLPPPASPFQFRLPPPSA